MTFALIEVEATAKKAARGAGYSWGMAEEAARATRWLCASGIDGVAALAATLIRVDGTDLSSLAPTALNGDWQGKSGTTCPVTAGAALSDSTVFWIKDGKRLANVFVPILLLPFAAISARQAGTIVTVEWSGAKVITDGYAVQLDGDSDALMAIADEVRVCSGGKIMSPLPLQTRASAAEVDWAKLNDFAHRTYAPDTEESRLKGAGAGLNDND